MLNGIGGSTVAEAKLRMPFDEFQDWVTYANTRGTLNQGLRMEWLLARLSLQVNTACGGKGKSDDYLRYHDQPVDEEEATLDDFAALLGVKKVVK